MNLGLEGKRALVTGGSRGIGRAISLKLAAEGARVMVNYLRKSAPAQEVVARIRADGGEAHAVKANVADEQGMAAIFAQVDEVWGGVDIIVANAASGVLRPITEVTLKHWHWTMDVNAWPLVTLVQGALERMGAGGAVVAISSLGAMRGIPFYSLVGASKAALESLIRQLTVDLSRSGIRFNAVSAGAVDTDALRYFPNRQEILDDFVRRAPAGRTVTPEDVADVVAFLCSERSSMIRGQTIVVDGGYSVRG